MLRHFVPHFLPKSGHCVLSCGTQRRALSRHQSNEMKILNILFPLMVIEPTTVYNNTLCRCATTGPNLGSCRFELHICTSRDVL